MTYAFPKSKYRNEKTGGNASKLEAAVAQLYWLRQKAGELLRVEEQVHVAVCGLPGHECQHKTRVVYIADFRLTRPDGSIFHGEAKGFQSEVYRVKRRLWMHYGHGELEVWGGSWKRPVLIERLG